MKTVYQQSGIDFVTAASARIFLTNLTGSDNADQDFKNRYTKN